MVWIKIRREKKIYGMRALILNSGMGSRMGTYTKEHPKCMTDIAKRAEDGFTETILSRQLRLLEKNGIQKVVMTTGLFDQVLMDYCNSLRLDLDYTFVKNPVYDKTNYIYSIYMAREELNDDIVLMHGDLVFEESVLADVLNAEQSCMVVSSVLPLPEKDFKARIADEGYIKAVGVDIFDHAVEAQALYKLYQKEWQIWLQEIISFCKAGNVSCYAENALNQVTGRCRILPLDVRDRLCSEIDDPKDLAAVQMRVKAFMED